MKRSQTVAGALMCVCQMGIVGMFFSLSYIQNKFINMQIDYFWLLAAVLAVYFIDVIALRRGITISVYITLQAVFAVGAVILWTRIVSVEPYRAWTEISTGIFYALQIVSAAIFAYVPVSPRAAALWFDAACIASAFLLLLEGFMDIPCAGETTVMCIISAVSALVMLTMATSSKNDDGGSARANAPQGKAALSAGMCVGAALIVAFSVGLVRTLKTVSGAAAKILAWCAGALTAAVQFIYGILYAVMNAIASRIDMPKVSGEAQAMPMIPGGKIDYSEMDFEVPSSAYIIAGVIAAAILALIIWKLRGISAKAHTQRLKSARIRREKDGHGKGRGIFAGMMAAIAYYWRRSKYRASAAGLLDYCMRCAGKTLPRKQGESGQGYLLRLSKNGYTPQLSNALASLARSVERDFYSGKRSEVAQDVYKAIHCKKYWKNETASS